MLAGWVLGAARALYCVWKCESLKSEQKNFAVPDLMLVAFIRAARQEQDKSSDPGQFGGCLSCFASPPFSACSVSDALDWKDVTGPLSRRKDQLEGAE